MVVDDFSFVFFNKTPCSRQSFVTFVTVSFSSQQRCVDFKGPCVCLSVKGQYKNINSQSLHILLSSVLFFDIHWHRRWNQATAAAGDHGHIARERWSRWGWCGCGRRLRLLHLLFIDFPLFSTPVLEPDLHLSTTCHESYWKEKIPSRVIEVKVVFFYIWHISSVGENYF